MKSVKNINRRHRGATSLMLLIAALLGSGCVATSGAFELDPEKGVFTAHVSVNAGPNAGRVKAPPTQRAAKASRVGAAAPSVADSRDRDRGPRTAAIIGLLVLAAGGGGVLVLARSRPAA